MQKDDLHVDYDLVWDVATVDVYPLIVELERIVPPDKPERGARAT